MPEEGTSQVPTGENRKMEKETKTKRTNEKNEYRKRTNEKNAYRKTWAHREKMRVYRFGLRGGGGMGNAKNYS